MFINGSFNILVLFYRLVGVAFFGILLMKGIHGQEPRYFRVMNEKRKNGRKIKRTKVGEIGTVDGRRGNKKGKRSGALL